MLSHANRATLQSTLSPLLREMAIKRVLYNPDEKNAHLHGTTAAINAELDKYFQERRAHNIHQVRTSVIGDIFIRHPLIKQAFERLYLSNIGIAAAQAALSQWWADVGHDQFLQRMQKPAVSAGEVDLYAGDLELAQLGASLGVNILVQSVARNIDTLIYRANGKMPDELVADARILADRGIIDNFGWHWQDLSLAELNARLDAVPQYNDIVNWIAASNAFPQRGDRVPQGLSSASLAQLQARGIVDEAQQYFIVSLAQQEFMDRIIAVPSKDQVIKAWARTYYPAPMIVLQNEYAAHWNNLRPTPAGYVVEAAKGDGNCAFNAFVLGLCEPTVLNRLNLADNHPFVIEASKRLRVLPATWNNLKNQLLQASAVVQAAQSTAKTSSALTTGQHATINSVVKTTALPYSPIEGEREVNDAVNEAFDLLNANRPPFSNKQVEKKFEQVFKDFSSLLDDFKNTRIDVGFFKQAKANILNRVQQDIQHAQALAATKKHK
jgi:hypothetical protein